MTTLTTANRSLRTCDLDLFPFPVAAVLEPTSINIPEDAEVSDAELSLSAEELADMEDVIVSNAIANAQAFDLDDMVGMYLREIGAMPLLTHDEEIELARQMEIGRDAREQMLAAMESDNEIHPDLKAELAAAITLGNEAQNTLISHNTRLAVSVARRYNNRGVDLQDLIQEGNLGLMRATTKFNYRRGFRFSTYATWWVRQSVTRAVANLGRTIRVPIHANELIAKLSKAGDELRQEGVHNPTLTHIAKKLNMAPNKVLEIVELTSQAILSLDSPIKQTGDENGTLLEDIIPGDPNEVEDQIDQNLLRELFENVFDQLDPVEYRVLKLRYGFGEDKTNTLDEIAEKLCLGREAVRYIEGKALKAFRQPSILNQLSSFI